MEPSHPPKPRTLSLHTYLNWLLETLALLSAIVFGIWAPVSYYATLRGNSGNNEGLKQLIGKMARLSDMQMSLIEEMRGLRGTIVRRGGLQAVEFCERNKDYSACVFGVADGVGPLLGSLLNGTVAVGKDG